MAESLRRVSAADRLLRGHTRTCLSYECCVLSGRGLCDGLIPRPEESFLL